MLGSKGRSLCMHPGGEWTDDLARRDLVKESCARTGYGAVS